MSGMFSTIIESSDLGTFMTRWQGVQLQINPSGTALASRAGSGYTSWLICISCRSLFITSRFLSSSFQSHPSSWWMQWTKSDWISRSTKRSKNTCRVIQTKNFYHILDTKITVTTWPMQSKRKGWQIISKVTDKTTLCVLLGWYLTKGFRIAFTTNLKPQIQVENFLN